MPSHPRVVRVLAAGAALSLSACGGRQAVTTSNPPPPEPPPVLRNPPAVGLDLPTWDAVASGHPEGTTNPPRPLLVVTEDGSRCWKDWVGGMLAPGPEESLYGGHVIASADQATGTEVQCPPEAASLLAAWQAARGSAPTDESAE